MERWGKAHWLLIDLVRDFFSAAKLTVACGTVGSYLSRGTSGIQGVMSLKTHRWRMIFGRELKV